MKKQFPTILFGGYGTVVMAIQVQNNIHCTEETAVAVVVGVVVFSGVRV